MRFVRFLGVLSISLMYVISALVFRTYRGRRIVPSYSAALATLEAAHDRGELPVLLLWGVLTWVAAAGYCYELVSWLHRIW